MKIQYRVDMEDLAIFNRHWMKTSPYIRRRRIGFTVVFGLIFLALGFFELLQGRPLAAMLRIESIGFLFLALFWFFSGRVRMKALKRIYGSESNAGVLCVHELELLSDGLVERTDVGEHKVLFKGIERVESTKSHTYIYIGTMQAHVIPHGKITEGYLPVFLQNLNQAREAAATAG